LPVGWLLHVIAARDVIVSGPGDGNEATYVRADKWIPNWKDMPVEKAERELLVKYLGAFGPTTLQDFALWAGMYVRDAKPIWQSEAENLVHIDVEGWKASMLQSDLPDLEKAALDEPVVRPSTIFRLIPSRTQVSQERSRSRKPQEDLSQSRMGLPGPSSGWQSARRMVPSTE